MAEVLKKRSFYARHKEAVSAALILTPMMLWWVAACGFPLAFGFSLGFFDWVGINATPTFAGLKNFIDFFKDSYCREVLWTTIWLGVATTLITGVAGFGTALLLNVKIKGRGIFRSIWYLPAITSTVAVSQILALFLNPIDGYLTGVFRSLGLEPIVFATSAGWGFFFIIFYSLWKGVGGSALLWLAGLQCIDPVLYEAAKVDGCGRGRLFLNITLPGLKPIVTFIVITGMIGALQIYEPVAFITNGEPVGKTMVLALQIFKDGFGSFNFGWAGAESMILAVITFAASATYYALSRRKSKNDA